LPLTLREYEPARGVLLTIQQRDQLAALAPSVTITPIIGSVDHYDLTPGSWVGVVHLTDLDIIIRPKVELDRLLFMMSYSLGRIRDLDSMVSLKEADDLPEAIVMAFVRLTSRALARGVQQGYRTVDDSSLTLRGRLRVGDQIRRRYGPMPPAEVTYDEFTVDIELNRLLLAATDRLSRIRFRSEASRPGLRGIRSRLEGVLLVPYDPRRLPAVIFNRLNERYRDAVTLARLILESASFDLGHGDAPATAFLVDMNRVFENFVVEALCDALASDAGVLVQGAHGRSLHLDEADRITLRPDLSIWRDSRCVFVGDAKYKRIVSAEYPNADIYQAVAYAVATGLDQTLLIYAAGEGQQASHEIVRIDKVINVALLDLSEPPIGLLRQIAMLADRIRLITQQSAAAAA
jgi:5-methylcytosine-specific restriction enzyme subunit McrC